MLITVLAFSPFFILLIYLFYGGEQTIYNIGVLNLDKGEHSIALIAKMNAMKGNDGAYLFKLTSLGSTGQIKEKVREKEIDLGIIIPADYSNKISDQDDNSIEQQAIVDFYGSIANIRYTMAALTAGDLVYQQGMEIKKITLPSTIKENFTEKKLPLNEFETYVPGLISLAVLMILFTASASIVRENETMTLIRLKISSLGAFNFLTGVCIVQAFIAVIAIIMAYCTALALGYKPAGGFGALIVVGILSSFSIVAVSLVVASYLDTVFDVLTIGCFPFFILMFFSGGMFPMPKMNLFTVSGHTFGITDILPLTHTTNAFNKILNYGSVIDDIVFDIVMIVLLTIIYFALGLILYNKRKLSDA